MRRSWPRTVLTPGGSHGVCRTSGGCGEVGFLVPGAWARREAWSLVGVGGAWSCRCRRRGWPGTGERSLWWVSCGGEGGQCPKQVSA